MRTILEAGITLAIAIGVLGGCGLLWRPLLPWRARPFLVLLAPSLGLALVSGVCHLLGGAGLPLAAIAWLFAVLAVAGWGTALVRRRLLRPRREIVAVLAVCGLAVLLASLPLIGLGYLTSVGATSDAVSYTARSEYLQHAPLRVPPAAEGLPVQGLLQAHLQMRAGDVYLLGLVGLLTGHRSYQILTLIIALFFGLTPGAVFVWARLALRLRRRAALLAAGLVAINNLVLWAVFDNFLSQAVGLSLFPLLYLFAVEGVRQRGWRSAAVFGALVATMASIYPVYALYALAAAGIYWVAAWLPGHRTRELPRLAAWWLTAAGCAVLVNGLALVRAFRELGVMSLLLTPRGVRILGAGDILVFPSVYEVGGLVCHAAAAMTVSPWPLPRGSTSLLALAAAAFALHGWWRLAPRPRLAAAVLLLVGAALAAHQRLAVNPPDGYPYGYFKAVSILPLQVMVLVAAGIAAAWRRPGWRAAALLALLAIAGLNLMNSLWSARWAWKNTLLTRDLIATERVAAALPRGAWVMMDVDPSPPLRKTWIAYLWQDRVRIWSPRDALSPPLPFFRWAFVERDLDRLRRRTSTEPWYDPTRYGVVWQTPRFVLRERRDGLLAEMRWEAPLLRPGGSLEIELQPRRHGVAGLLAGSPSAAELADGTPRRVRVSAFGAGDADTRLEVEGAGSVALGAGGWVLDFDLGCRRGQPRVRLRNAGPGDVLVSEVAVAGSPVAGARPCLAVEALGTGAAYVEQEVAPPRLRYQALLWMPRDHDRRSFHLGVHVTNVASAALFGVWSLPFPAGKRAHRGSLEIDLSDGRSRAEVDGRPARVGVVALDLERGSFGLSTVIWQVQPVAQISVDNLLWFSRAADGTIAVTRVNPHSPVTVIPSQLPAPR